PGCPTSRRSRAVGTDGVGVNPLARGTPSTVIVKQPVPTASLRADVGHPSRFDPTSLTPRYRYRSRHPIPTPIHDNRSRCRSPHPISTPDLDPDLDPNLDTPSPTPDPDLDPYLDPYLDLDTQSRTSPTPGARPRGEAERSERMAWESRLGRRDHGPRVTRSPWPADAGNDHPRGVPRYRGGPMNVGIGSGFVPQCR
ncbi:MAG: hypothetical protein RLZZ238_1851, partial [Planctomycetota bacterium]